VAVLKVNTGLYRSREGESPRRFGAMTATTSRHRALADAHRVRIVEELRAAEGGLDAAELADRVGLHPNTVRWHLGILADAGLVGSSPAARARPGRPRTLYSLEPEPAEHGTDEHRLLATVLTGALAASEDGAVRAEEAGEAWGRYLLARDPLERVRGDGVEEVVELLDQQGFEPSPRRRDPHGALPVPRARGVAARGRVCGAQGADHRCALVARQRPRGRRPGRLRPAGISASRGSRAGVARRSARVGGRACRRRSRRPSSRAR
jgi:predicted ArsR family transcriptional regulator